MPSADQVPTKSSHSTMLWHMWVVLIAGSTGSALRAVRPPNLHITPVVRRDLAYRASATGSLYRSPLASWPPCRWRVIGRYFFDPRWPQSECVVPCTYRDGICVPDGWTCHEIVVKLCR